MVGIDLTAAAIVRGVNILLHVVTRNTAADVVANSALTIVIIIIAVAGISIEIGERKVEHGAGRQLQRGLLIGLGGERVGVRPLLSIWRLLLLDFLLLDGQLLRASVGNGGGFRGSAPSDLRAFMTVAGVFITDIIATVIDIAALIGAAVGVSTMNIAVIVVISALVGVEEKAAGAVRTVQRRHATAVQSHLRLCRSHLPQSTHRPLQVLDDCSLLLAGRAHIAADSSRSLGLAVL
mmetsp:Transcript_29088/g.39975  ORF Transcript_29088/g.39975 Transcript_29088/m.39975 type:complete len:236 (-) Transcript_29088:1487-2194(-)